MEIKKIILKHRLFFRIAFSFCRVNEVSGVCSNIDPERRNHFLMWDFDGIDYDLVELALFEVQLKYNLPQIDIIKTTRGYHAYCFKSCNWRECRTIISDTDFVDHLYLAIAITRGYFTLRYTLVPGEPEFQPIGFIRSNVKSDLSYKEATHFVDYTRAVK